MRTTDYKERVLSLLAGIGIGLMLSAAILERMALQVTIGIVLLVASLALRYFFEK